MTEVAVGDAANERRPAGSSDERIHVDRRPPLGNVGLVGKQTRHRDCENLFGKISKQLKRSQYRNKWIVWLVL